MPISESQGMLRELLETHRQTDRQMGGRDVGGSDTPKTEKKGHLRLFEFEWEGEGLGGGGRLFEAGHLLTFSTVRMGAYSRRVLTRGWALIRIIRWVKYIVDWKSTLIGLS